MTRNQVKQGGHVHDMDMGSTPRYGKCWLCGYWPRLRKDGTLGWHRRPGGNRPVCDGVGRTPGESGLV